MDEERKAIVPAKQKRDAVSFGSREVIRELGERLAATMPGAQKLTPGEALTLAQVAVAHHLDPWVGEIWYLKDRDGKPLGVMIGIKGLRKTAQRQLGRFRYWLEEFESIDPADFHMPEGSIGYRVKLHDSKTLISYIELAERLHKMGHTKDQIETALGPVPFTVGYGWAKPGEFTKMNLYAAAQKRAEADALKRRFYIPLGLEYGEQVDEVFGEEAGEVVDNDFDDLKDGIDLRVNLKAAEEAAGVETEPEEGKGKAVQGKILSELGYPQDE